MKKKAKKVTKKRTLSKRKFYVVIRGFDQMFEFNSKKHAILFTDDIEKKYPGIQWAIGKAK